jgi:hypothetical protein
MTFARTVWLLISALLLVVNGVAQAQSVACLTGPQLRSMLASTWKLPDARQEIVVGPLKNGKAYHPVIVYSSTPSRTEAASTKRSGAGYVININARAVGAAILVLDAQYLCAHNPQVYCSHTLEYLIYLNQVSDPSEASTIDEFIKADPQASCRIRSERIYVAGMRAAYEDTLLEFILHELGHIALGHLDGKTCADAICLRNTEAEADGFAMEVQRISGRPPATAAPLMALAAAQTSPQLNPKLSNYPPPACRLQAAANDVARWWSTNASHELAGSDTPELRRLLKRLERFLLSSDEAHSAIDESINCTEYLEGVTRGIQRAASLVDQNTTLDVAGPVTPRAASDGAKPKAPPAKGQQPSSP